MSDDATKFEQHKSQLVGGLTVVAESMRRCAEMAEAFAAFVNGGAISVDSPAARMMIRDFVAATKSNTLVDDKTSTGKRKRKTDATEEGDAPKRRKRKPKDPNAPKRPASSYILFQNEVRKELKALHPSMSNHELLNLIAKQWQEMSEEDKAVYHQAMATAKERYSQDKKAYDNRTPEEIQAANAAAAATATAKKPRRGAKAAASMERQSLPIPLPPPQKPAAAEVSAGTDTSEGEASDESDEEVHEEHDDEQETSSSEDEKHTATRVTPGTGKYKKASA